MNKEKFQKSFIDDYPFSCMTIKDLMNIIESWSSDNMPFNIEDEWSWRGSYSDPCLYVTNSVQSKEHNLRMLNDLLEHSFTGWKGGEYYYDESSLLHFENDPACSTLSLSNSFWLKFLNDNEDNQFVHSIYEYFDNDKHLNNVYCTDFFKHDLKEGNNCVYWTESGLKEGKIFTIDKLHKFVVIAQKIDKWRYSKNVSTMDITEFDKVIQLRED